MIIKKLRGKVNSITVSFCLLSTVLTTSLFCVATVVYQVHFGLLSGVAKADYVSFGRLTENNAFEMVSLREFQHLSTQLPQVDFAWEVDWNPYDLEVGGIEFKNVIVQGISENYIDVLGLQLIIDSSHQAQGRSMGAVLSFGFYNELLSKGVVDIDRLYVEINEDTLIPVVAVATKDFRGLDPSRKVDLWIVNPEPSIDQSIRNMPPSFRQPAFEGMMGMWRDMTESGV